MFRKVSMAALAILVVSSMAFAGGDANIAKGKVTAVSGNTVTVAGEDGESWSFEVTGKTRVVAEGAGHKAQRLSSTGRKTTLDEFVREHHWVTVKYQEQDGTRYVQNLRVH